MTQTIPTKFSDQDVSRMDILIEREQFISRSDLIRQAARNLVNQQAKMMKTYGDVLVNKMKQEGDFNRIEWKTLANLYLKPDTQDSELNDSEKKAIRKLLRDPFGVLRKKNDQYVLTKNGESLVKGYLKGLLYSKTLQNA